MKGWWNRDSVVVSGRSKRSLVAVTQQGSVVTQPCRTCFLSIRAAVRSRVTRTVVSLISVVLRRGGRFGQEQAEGAAFAAAVVQLEASAVGGSDGESEARAGFGTGLGGRVERCRPVEAVEDARGLVGVDAGAVVGDLDDTDGCAWRQRWTASEPFVRRARVAPTRARYRAVVLACQSRMMSSPIRSGCSARGPGFRRPLRQPLTWSFEALPGARAGGNGSSTASRGLWRPT